MTRRALQTAAAHDLDDRITGLTLQDGATLVSSLSYAYGDALNLTAVNDNVASANSVRLGYTPANRLGSATGPWGSASYTYDAVGNRLNHVVTSGSTTTRIASYGASNNRITGMTENAAALRSYTYDGNGNILTDTRPSEVFAFTYNARNRPVSVTRNAVAYAAYGYNALEQLVSRSTAAPGGPSGTIHYIHDLDGRVIAEADGATGATTREYIWLTPATGLVPVDLPIGLVSSGNLYLVHTDHLARPIRVTDATRATVWQASYTPWVEPQAISGTLALDLRFPGQLFQIETGLSYNWHRHYDPVTGRYTQPDPLRFVDGPSVYAYATSSPFIYVDEEGQNAVGVLRGGATLGRVFGNWCAQTPACLGLLGPPSKVAVDAAKAAAQALANSIGGETPEEKVREDAKAAAGAEQCTPQDPNGTKRKSSRQMRKEWEEQNGELWPKDPKTGRNQDISHVKARADGGSDGLDNYEPLPHDEHVQQHMNNGDFIRWGGRRNGP